MSSVTDRLRQFFLNSLNPFFCRFFFSGCFQSYTKISYLVEVFILLTLNMERATERFLLKEQLLCRKVKREKFPLVEIVRYKKSQLNEIEWEENLFTL